MRRFMAYFNALLLGMIFGMIFLAIFHAYPADRQNGSGRNGIDIVQKTLAISISLARCAHEQTCALRK